LSDFEVELKGKLKLTMLNIKKNPSWKVQCNFNGEAYDCN